MEHFLEGIAPLRPSTLVSRIAAYMLLFFFGKFCTPICLIQAYASINFQKNCKNIVLKIRFYTNPYASIQNFSTLCLYDFFEIASSMRLFPTMLQYGTLEYLLKSFTKNVIPIIVKHYHFTPKVFEIYFISKPFI